MKTIEIIIDGEKYQAQMSVDEIKKLVEKPVRTGYERVDNRNHYYYSDAVGEIGVTVETQNNVDSKRHNTANYYSDKTLAENNARAEKLMRQLRRFAVEENAKAGITLDWSDGDQYKYYIDFNYRIIKIEINGYQTYRVFGDIYFTTEEIALKAIEAFKNELLWYFMEYKNYYVEDSNDDRN